MEGDATTDRIRVVIDAELEELIPGFLENRDQDVRDLRAALAEGDLETVRRLGHGMKGSGGGYGFDPISTLGRALEEAARDQRPDDAARRIEELADYLARLEVVYEP